MKQNDIKELPKLEDNRYENIFNVYQTTDTPKSFYFYNINKSVQIDVDKLNKNVLIEGVIKNNMPWTIVSYKAYGTIYLWWLIKILNPKLDYFIAHAGDTVKILKPEYISSVIRKINE